MPARRVFGAAVLVAAAVAMGWFVIGGRERAASDPTACAAPVEEQWVRGGTSCLHMRLYRGAMGAGPTDLVVVLHGDAPFAPPSYQYAAARQVVSVRCRGLAAAHGRVAAVTGLVAAGPDAVADHADVERRHCHDRARRRRRARTASRRRRSAAPTRRGFAGATRMSR